MKKGIITLLFVLAVSAIQAQRQVDRTNFRAGVSGGIVTGDFSDFYSLNLGVDLYHHWGVSELFDVGVTAGFFNAFGEKQTVGNGGLTFETEFANAQFLPLGASIRMYPTSNTGFKLGGDIGYAVGINEGNEGAIYYRPSLAIDLRNGASELGVSYLIVSDEVAFSSVLLSYLILF